MARNEISKLKEVFGGSLPNQEMITTRSATRPVLKNSLDYLVELSEKEDPSSDDQKFDLTKYKRWKTIQNRKVNKIEARNLEKITIEKEASECIERNRNALFEQWRQGGVSPEPSHQTLF